MYVKHRATYANGRRIEIVHELRWPDILLPLDSYSRLDAKKKRTLDIFMELLIFQFL
jgi:hypothetical protein